MCVWGWGVGGDTQNLCSGTGQAALYLEWHGSGFSRFPFFWRKHSNCVRVCEVAQRSGFNPFPFSPPLFSSSFFQHTVILCRIIFLCSISGKLDLNASSLHEDRKHAAHVVPPAHLESSKSSGSFLSCPGKTNSSMTGYHKATPQCISDLG